MAGRPSTYTEKLSDEICGRITNGESLSAICREPAMPAPSSVFKWLREHPSFSERYAIARQEQADTLADQITAIADDLTGDPARDRLRIDARKWIASKLKPKAYGDKVDMTHSGGDTPIQHEIEVRIVKAT